MKNIEAKVTKELKEIDKIATKGFTHLRRMLRGDQVECQ